MGEIKTQNGLVKRNDLGEDNAQNGLIAKAGRRDLGEINIRNGFVAKAGRNDLGTDNTQNGLVVRTNGKLNDAPVEKAIKLAKKRTTMKKSWKHIERHVQLNRG